MIYLSEILPPTHYFNLWIYHWSFRPSPFEFTSYYVWFCPTFYWKCYSFHFIFLKVENLIYSTIPSFWSNITHPLQEALQFSTGMLVHYFTRFTLFSYLTGMQLACSLFVFLPLPVPHCFHVCMDADFDNSLSLSLPLSFFLPVWYSFFSFFDIFWVSISFISIPIWYPSTDVFHQL